MSVEIWDRSHDTLVQSGRYVSYRDRSVWFLVNERVPRAVENSNNAVLLRRMGSPDRLVVADLNPADASGNFDLTIRGTHHVLTRT